MELANPKMTTHTVLRDWLLPSLLEFLGSNTHVEYPQRIFEVGPCEKLVESNLAETKTVHNLSAVTAHASAGFTEIRAALDGLLANLGLEGKVQPQTHPSSVILPRRPYR